VATFANWMLLDPLEKTELGVIRNYSHGAPNPKKLFSFAPVDSSDKPGVYTLKAVQHGQKSTAIHSKHSLFRTGINFLLFLDE